MLQKIAVITGTRAEFGILSPLLQKIRDDESIELQIIACAMHLSPEFGYTIDEINQAGFKVNKKVECLLSSDTAVGVSKSVGLAIISMAEAYEELKPDLVLVLGDRSEMLAAASAATLANIPLAHIHGGETTEGAYDESIRHAITKMSYLHFASTETYRKRIIQLGESPNRVFNVGAMGLDSIRKLKLLTRKEFEKAIDFPLGKKNILITYHPVTLENKTAQTQFLDILSVLDELEEVHLIFTHANSDKEGRKINSMIEEYVQKHKSTSVSFKSLGQLRYLSALKYVDLVLGNSSSGVIEVPFFNKPTINIGDRQAGRVSASSVINVSPDKNHLRRALEKAFDHEFKDTLVGQAQLYGDGDAADKILEKLKNQPAIDLKKRFFDLNFEL